MDTLLSPEMIQWERVAAIIENVANFPRPFTRYEFSQFIGSGYTSGPARDLLNEHFCQCKDGFIRIRSLAKSLEWIQENITC